MMTGEPSERQTFWERHELKFYRYGHIYASICGQVIIDYAPQRPIRAPFKLLLIAYSHVLSLLLIVVLPGYFGYNYRALTATDDRRIQLVLYVGFANTLIKYATVIVTYVANTCHFEAINQRCSLQRARLQAAFAASYRGSGWPKRSFELFMYLKFVLINLMIIVQICAIFAIARIDSDTDSDSDSDSDSAAAAQGRRLRIQFAIYAFVLWNYTENMADYFYYVNSCVLLYFRLLHMQLQEELEQLRRLGCGRLLLYGCRLCDRIGLLRERYAQIHGLYADSFRMHQFQLLGLMLTTLITNLTNLFTIFNLLATSSCAFGSFPIAVSGVYALGFYLDTYLLSLVGEYIKVEQTRLALTVRQFSESPALQPPSLNQELEQFSLLLMHCRQPMLCGVVYLDRRLIYLISVTAFSYFITLVQFDIYLRTQHNK
ncbi:uncharacterized protein Dmoj_GI14894 [Drosophila mojavensis]|uniref:Gustatory receptor n=1 Tax=Drosophila mojavensis TaxID=7230 RepID=B4L4A6_DROMO|nr:uncharacterized protein Dmoj_GI14894 [Drosophila mojavensis]